jgi:hypothetical protein
MLVKKETKHGVTVYYVDKDVTDEKMATLKNTYVKPSQINLVITDDADVYTTEGVLLLRFRKNKLTKSNVNTFFDNVIDFAKNTTSNRGSTSGSKSKNIYDNPKIMTNILGYFDRFSPSQKVIMTKSGVKLLGVRECRFNMDYPEKYKRLVPMIREIDEFYKQYIPDKYAKQKKKANQTPFKIANTSFTTVTTNVNFQTTIHKDVGDDADGFGNLAVVEDGKYSGGETCFPQYGVGVDVRTNDILFMDVHEWHGNLPIKKETPDVQRLSVVCYLRYNVWDRTKNKTKKFLETHNKTVRNLRNYNK